MQKQKGRQSGENGHLPAESERKQNMNQKERMLANLPYKAWLDGLEEERLESRKKVYRFNNTPPENEEER